MPNCENTYCVKPLQSKPVGVDPPVTYGTPRNASAVAARVRPSRGRPDGSSAVRGRLGVAGGGSVIAGDATGAVVVTPPRSGIGKGFGTALVVAHAPAISPARTKTSVWPARMGRP